ncbi:hypothetical protein [Bordetella genomosp. 12]|uniref:Lipoprotein n=1 Tax=Bordetella genomosp. 12 TaxID=463035 RepID=A0A261VKL5_9BORD|nr:hypothetical protein [Bordetella genomosp. 12]OZI74678.1 hypothetical protein CAL22_09500 [Bordetella genomosp. 12]
MMAGCLAALLLGGCSVSGHNFDGGKLSTLTPGLSTLNDATRALGALPDQVYGRPDGGQVVLWRSQITFVTDGFYSRKEALLQFGPDGRLVRLLNTTNILLEPWEREKLLGPAPQPPAVAAAAAAPPPGLEVIVIPGPAETAAR